MVKSSRIYTAALIVIGDEILSGRTHDKNIAQVAGWLGVQGIRLAEVRVVADVTAAIVEAVNTLRERNDYLFPSHRGGYITKQRADQIIKEMARRANLQRNVHAHLFRHGHAINFLNHK